MVQTQVQQPLYVPLQPVMMQQPARMLYSYEPVLRRHGGWSYGIGIPFA